MLAELVVEHLGVIEGAELQLGPGCSALTGETGAGKTLVVAALALLMGGRAERLLVREGASGARIEGRFVVDAAHPCVRRLEDHGLVEPSGGDVQIVLHRTVAVDGQGGKARVNGRLVTVGTLADIGRSLVEIAGQHDHVQIGEPAYQRRVLDSFAGALTSGLAARVAAAVRSAAIAKRTVAELATGERARERELDVLRYEIDEIRAAKPVPGEEAHLVAEARRLEHAESIALGLQGASSLLHKEGGAEDVLGAAAAELRRIEEHDPALGELAARLEGAALEVADVAAEVAGAEIAPDHGALEAAHARLAVLARLTRKYGEGAGGVLEYLTGAEARLVQLEGTCAGLAAAQRDLTAGEAAAAKLASELSGIRRAAAPALAEALASRLVALAMPDARVEVLLAPKPLGEGGAESVELRLAANPGETPKPVGKVASGGELSRLGLAVHLVASRSHAGTMVFDEVDAGVGGTASQSIGRALAELVTKTGVQVLVVTHLPQVAAYADEHFSVTKTTAGERSAARVERVEDIKRVEELSRMLSGLPTSRSAREHAQELLQLASQGAR